MDGLIGAVRSGFTEAFRLQGRTSRAGFWWWWLAVLVVLALTDGSALGALAGLLLLVPSFTIVARRLHDTGRSGWSWLVALVPLVGPFLLVVWLAQPGDVAPNRFGPPPPNGPVR